MIAEIGLALLLVTGAGLLVRSVIQLNRVDPGFDPDHLLTAQVLLTRPMDAKPAATIAFFHDLLDRLRATPGIRSASGDTSLPFTAIIHRTDFTIVNRPRPPRGQQWDTSVHVVLSNYFQTMGIALLRGRTFNEAEQTEMRHVVVVSETLARRYFPDTDPIGQRIVIDMKDDNSPSTIIGVVADVHEEQVDQAPGAAVYWPFPELPTRVMTLAVRTSGDPAAILPAIRAEVRSLDPDLPLAAVRTMDAWMSDSVGRARFATALLTVLAAIALLLAGVGVYSVMANTVTERAHEIGLRIALGADRRAVLRLVFWRSARLTVVGIVLGMAGALVVTRSLRSLLFEITPSDPVTMAAGAALLAVIALLACIVPAHRAMRVDPAIALRHE